MAATAMRAPLRTRERAAAPGQQRARLFEPSAGSPSLEDLIVGTWDELVTSGSARCPVCEHRIERATPCESCGSELA
jgi:hypothetical protein